MQCKIFSYDVFHAFFTFHPSSRFLAAAVINLPSTDCMDCRNKRYTTLASLQA